MGCSTTNRQKRAENCSVHRARADVAEIFKNENNGHRVNIENLLIEFLTLLHLNFFCKLPTCVSAEVFFLFLRSSSRISAVQRVQE